MGEDMYVNAIVWLTSKSVNLIAAVNGIYPCQGANLAENDPVGVGVESPIAVNLKILLERAEGV